MQINGELGNGWERANLLRVIVAGAGLGRLGLGGLLLHLHGLVRHHSSCVIQKGERVGGDRGGAVTDDRVLLVGPRASHTHGSGAWDVHSEVCGTLEDRACAWCMHLVQYYIYRRTAGAGYPF